MTRKLRVLMLSRYGNLGPGSRIRMYQYLPYLRSQGVEVTVAPLLDDDYVSRLYERLPVNKWRVARSYLERLGRLLTAQERFDLIWLQWEVFPWLPGALETLLLRGKIPVVADYDDAIFHRYDLHRSALVRALLGRKIDAVMKAAGTVVVGNEYLGGRAREAGAKRVVSLPSVIDIDRYQVANRSESDEFTIGWMGTPTTAGFMSAIAAPLAQFCRNGGRRVTIVGAKEIALPDVPVTYKAWSEDSEAADIASFDVGVMPLPDDPWSNGKCGYKLIQYMACGVPVVASPVGINSQIVDHGGNGFLATTSEDWFVALEAMAKSGEMRREMGMKARKRVVDSYCLQVTAPLLLAVLREAVG